MAANSVSIQQGIEGQAAKLLRNERRCDPRDEDLAGWHSTDWDEPATRRNTDPAGEQEPTLVQRLADELVPFTVEELEAAKEPHPHAFQDGDSGLAPVGEVTVIAAPGREGKTFATISLAVSYVLGTKVVELPPQPNRSVVIYSAEDDRRQYARKVAAQVSRLGREDARRARENILVPDLTQAGMEAFCSLVTMAERRPIESLAINSIVDALKGLMTRPVPPGLLVFETASTLSDADEDNVAFKTMIRALRRIARELQVAVVLVHHTSQAAANNLPELNLGVSDIRGGTALAFNARQCFLLVNLGSEADPMPEQDARTVLRQMAAPHARGRVTALICLDSSKSVDPPPVFFEWTSTEYGPALAGLPVPFHLRGATWRKLHQMIRAQRAEKRQEAKDEARHTSALQVVAIVRNMAQRGQQPTARAVSIAAGRSPTWAKPHLDAAVGLGELTVQEEAVPRTKGKTAVYRPVHSTEGAQ